MIGTFQRELLSVLEPVRVSLHVPGHKYGRLQAPGSVWSWDTTEIPGTDNLHEPEGLIRDAQRRVRDYYRSCESWFLVNGTTGGILASLMAVLEPGDGVLIGRDCHQSVYHGAWLAHARLHFVQPQYRGGDLMNLGISPDAVKKALEVNSGIRAVVVTHPTYFGICSDIGGIAAVCHRHGAVLIVDEAHGAHLPASKRLPQSALNLGADLVVQSAHKTLPALTQGSLLHAGSNRVDLEKLRWMLRIFQSSSPSYVLMASLDEAVELLAREGTERLERLMDFIEAMKRRLARRGIVMEGENIKGTGAVNGFDSTRLILRGCDFGHTGGSLSAVLRDHYGIQLEMTTPWHGVGVVSMASSEEDLAALETALMELQSVPGPGAAPEMEGVPALPETVLSWREAQTRPSEAVELNRSEGHVAHSLVVPYPPGAPVLVPGERITPESVAYVQACHASGISVIGMCGTENSMIRVVKA